MWLTDRALALEYLPRENEESSLLADLLLAVPTAVVWN